MNTSAGRNARTQSEAGAARRHTHTQHLLRRDRMLTRGARREVQLELANR